MATERRRRDGWKRLKKRDQRRGWRPDVGLKVEVEGGVDDVAAGELMRAERGRWRGRPAWATWTRMWCGRGCDVTWSMEGCEWVEGDGDAVGEDGAEDGLEAMGDVGVGEDFAGLACCLAWSKAALVVRGMGWCSGADMALQMGGAALP